jgi:hypothetical protein
LLFLETHPIAAMDHGKFGTHAAQLVTGCLQLFVDVFKLIDLFHPEIVAARVEPSDVLLRRQCAPRRAQLQMQLDEHAARIKKLQAAVFSK